MTRLFFGIFTIFSSIVISIFGAGLILTMIFHMDMNTFLVFLSTFVLAIIITAILLVCVICMSEGIRFKTVIKKPYLIIQAFKSQFVSTPPDPLWVKKQNLSLDEFSKMIDMMKYYDMMHSDHPMVIEAVQKLKVIWELAK